MRHDQWRVLRSIQALRRLILSRVVEVACYGCVNRGHTGETDQPPEEASEQMSSSRVGMREDNALSAQESCEVDQNGEIQFSFHGDNLGDSPYEVKRSCTRFPCARQTICAWH
jgi:hypothetical protein